MICSNCGHDNQPTAAFCGRCGIELSVDLSMELTAEQPTSAAPAAQDAVPSIAISTCSAAVGLLLPGLTVGGLVSMISYFPPSVGGTGWAGVGGGMALGLSLSASVRPLGSGRLPSVVGLMLVGAASWYLVIGDLLYRGSSLGIAAFFFGAFGAGIGLALPRAFWLRLRSVSPAAKTALAVAAIAGLAAGWSSTQSGPEFAFGLAGVVAIFIGLPFALVHPVVVVNRAREGG